MGLLTTSTIQYSPWNSNFAMLKIRCSCKSTVRTYAFHMLNIKRFLASSSWLTSVPAFIFQRGSGSSVWNERYGIGQNQQSRSESLSCEKRPVLTVVFHEHTWDFPTRRGCFLSLIMANYIALCTYSGGAVGSDAGASRGVERSLIQMSLCGARICYFRVTTWFSIFLW